MIKDFLINLIFPPRCGFCGEIAASGESCKSCAKELLKYKIPTETMRINHACFKKLDKCIALYYYKDIVRDGVLYAKFKSCDGFKRDFISISNFDFSRYFADNNIDCIISMPAHKSKFYENEYDLPCEMAKIISKQTGVEYNNKLVLKVKRTKNQHKLKKEKRKTNLTGAFELCDEVSGKNIVIIDDIITTGYSMEEVAKTLKKGGADKVMGIAFAYNV